MPLAAMIFVIWISTHGEIADERKQIKKPQPSSKALNGLCLWWEEDPILIGFSKMALFFLYKVTVYINKHVHSEKGHFYKSFKQSVDKSILMWLVVTQFH